MSEKIINDLETAKEMPKCLSVECGALLSQPCWSRIIQGEACTFDGLASKLFYNSVGVEVKLK